MVVEVYDATIEGPLVRQVQTVVVGSWTIQERRSVHFYSRGDWATVDYCPTWKQSIFINTLL